MNKWNYKKAFLLLLLTWFLINILQAVFTELHEDEAYYFLYGKYLNWGYFDHPPMVAVLVRISSLFFDGNLGVRLMTVLLQLGTLFLTWKVLNVKDPGPGTVITFFIIAASLIMFSAYGFITTPDAPLLFFTALFLYAYKKFIVNQSWSAVSLLSVGMAGLVYSKYHAILVIGLVVLSNLRLLKAYKFWIAGLVAVLLLSPHIYWQIDNGLPSFKYHLVDRSEGFRWTYFLEYLPNQMAVINPFTLGAVIYVLVRHKPEDLFTRALYFLIIGFIGFFWISSVRGHVEPHWTVACSIPILILLTERIASNQGLRRYSRYIIAPSIILILLVRIALLTNLPVIKRLDFNGKQEKIEFIESQGKGLPVAFISSFQLPSLYIYFTGKDAFALSTLYSRQTQFDIWQLEKKFQNKPVFVVDAKSDRAKQYEQGGLRSSGYVTDSLQTTNRIMIVFDKPDEIVRPGDTVRVAVTISNSGDYDVDFNHPRFPVQVCVAFIKGKDTHIQPAILSEPVGLLRQGESLRRSLQVSAPDLPAGTYQFGITLTTALGPTLNCTFVKLIIEGDD
jgi:4-amino-4-deoxy-L-arabinose transferase-like glycosyltransferase